MIADAQQIMTAEEFEFAFEYSSGDDFARWLERVEERRRGDNLPEWQVPDTFELAIVGQQVAGRVSVRHRLNEFLLRKGGHIGYGVLPAFRGCGVGKQLLKRGMEIAGTMGIHRVLVTCDDDNMASIRIIEGAGGALESTHTEIGATVPTRRYWIG
jgi:predicted acetyltransferase